MSEMIGPRTGLATLFAAMLPPVPVMEPEVEPIDLDAIAAAAHAQGFAEGRAEAEARLLPQRAAMAAAAAAFDAATMIDPARLRTPFITVVTALAEAVVMAELAVSPVVARLVDAALASIDREGTGLRVNAADVAAIGDVGLPIVADDALPQGTVIVEGPDFVVRDGLPERLAAVLAEIA